MREDLVLDCEIQEPVRPDTADPREFRLLRHLGEGLLDLDLVGFDASKWDDPRGMCIATLLDAFEVSVVPRPHADTGRGLPIALVGGRKGIHRARGKTAADQ